MTIRSIKYLSVAVLFAVSGCTYNQYTASRGGYDDLYGGRYDEPAVVAGERSARRADPNVNPDYQAEDASPEVVDQYYDENYVTARNIQRNTSAEVGYNAGFTDGYYAGRNNGFFNSGFMGGMYPMWGYPGFNVGFRLGMGSMISLGYSPFGWNRWNRWGSFYDPYWNSMAWGDPFMYGGYGYPYYGGFGSGFYGGMYGYNPYMWSNYYPIIVNNYGESRNNSRNYGPRASGNAVSRTVANSRSVREGTNNTTVNRTGARTGSGARVSDGSYYSRPRAASSASSRVSAGNSSSRVAGPRGGAATNGNYYYANPGSNRSGSYSGSEGVRTRSGAVYRSSESGRSSVPSSGYSTPARSGRTYTAPSGDSYSSPSRSYNTPSRSYSEPSRSYSTPSRSYSAPSAPSRSYSAPSGGGGGGSMRSSGGGGRGPR